MKYSLFYNQLRLARKPLPFKSVLILATTEMYTSTENSTVHITKQVGQISLWLRRLGLIPGRDPYILALGKPIITEFQPKLECEKYEFQGNFMIITILDRHQTGLLKINSAPYPLWNVIVLRGIRQGSPTSTQPLIPSKPVIHVRNRDYCKPML